MGESTSLVRSFSAPSDTLSCVHQQVQENPMRVLGESISFGRFLTESLDWEKWSTFSRNRYVEEAEKYSKPGSVAAKKAYFEARYKRKAAEKAATLTQEANAQANGTYNSETREGNCTDSSVEMNSKADSSHSIVTAIEQPDKDAVNCQGVDYTDSNHDECHVGQSDLDIFNVEGEEDVPHARIDTNLNLENGVLDNANQLDRVDVHKEIAVPMEERLPDPGTAAQEVLALPAGREVNSFPKLSTKTVAAKPLHSLDEGKATAAVPPRSGVNRGSKGKKTVGDSFEKTRFAARSLHMSISLPYETTETSKTAVVAVQSRNGVNSVSKSKKSVRGSVEKKRLTERSLHMSVKLPSGSSETSKTANAAVKPRSGINHATESMKSVGDSVEKRPTARSIHMSMNLPSGARVTSKTASVFECDKIKRTHSNLPSISKDHSVTLETSIQASHVFSDQVSANPPSKGRRIERKLNKSVSRGVNADAKLSSISVDFTESNQGSLTISSPFRFRSEERAAKRKEFLQRLDEIKLKAGEKVRLQSMPKEEIEHDYKKLRQSSSSKPKLNENRHGGSQSPSNQIRKISLTLPQSSKLVRKTSSSTGQDKNFRNLWKPPISTKNTKRVTEKINQTTGQTLTSLLKFTRENTSPNIQH